jgi:hypothetical protein
MQIRTKMDWKSNLQRLLSIFFIIIIVNLIYLHTAFAQENPRIYWTWHVSTMEKRGTYLVDIDYVTSENEDSYVREGDKNYIPVPDCCIGKNIRVGLESENNAFKIMGPSEFTLQPLMNDNHRSWDVQPIEAGDSKELKFKYKYEQEENTASDFCYIDVVE